MNGTKEVKRFEFTGVVANVTIPNLTTEERNKRLERIRVASEKLLKNKGEQK